MLEIDIEEGNSVFCNEPGISFDFRCLGVGDPSCDLVIAWTFLDSDGRKAFGDPLAFPSTTWDRARGCAIWKALVTLVKYRNTDSTEAESQHKVIRNVIDDQSAS